MSWPEKVGIRAIEVYFPSQYVDQTELEQFDGASAGKYTIGLGQHRMGFCSDREDINSLCLTVVKKLLERYQIKPQEIGRLEVGTETIIDKSKSVKSVLMQLFEPEGVTDLEGIDTTNACYGGTAALFNAVNWVESSNWDGRLALVVCGDIAIYAEGAARPTGGAGAVAMLIGPDAPLVLDRGVRSTFMKHAYDFYKPDLTSEYPIVDGPLSIQCYFNALDNCYQLYRKKYSKVHPEAKTIGLQQFDAVVFHTPFCKLVQKSFARIGMNDFVLLSREQRLQKYPELAQFADVKLEDMSSDRNSEKAFLNAFNNLFEAKTKKSLILASQIGNMYTPSVYLSLLSHLIHTDTADLKDKSIAAFSYGSGLASSLYSIKITSDVKQLQELKNHLNYILPLLQSRVKASPDEFTKILDTRKKNNHIVPREPSGNTDVLFPGTYYLKSIDKMHRRCYERV